MGRRFERYGEACNTPSHDSCPSPDFMKDAVRLPTDEEKEKVKLWVKEHSCKAWHNGWCLVDGTLIPLYAQPYWYGESYFDCKCNYLLNIQVSCS